MAELEGTIEEERVMRLAQGRRGAGSAAERIVTRAARQLADKLNEEIKEGHDFIGFSIAFLLASLKDGVDIVLDFLLIGEIPIVGQIPGLFLSAFLTFFLLGKGWFLKTRVRGIYYILALFVDNLPLLNNLPLNTLTILYAWHLTREKARQSGDNLGKLKTATKKEIEAMRDELAQEEEIVYD